MMKYGMEGYGLYFYCVELVAGTVDHNNITFELEHDAEIIAHDTGIHYERVQEMMAYMVNLGLFEERGGIITCMKLARRIDQSMTSNSKMRQLIRKLQDSHDGVMTESTKGHARSRSRSRSRREKTLSGKPDPAHEILQFLNEKAGRKYQPVEANLELIRSRLKEGYPPEQFRQVIAKKCREWGNDEMSQYLRPATLFNKTKFAQYTGELT